MPKVPPPPSNMTARLHPSLDYVELIIDGRPLLLNWTTTRDLVDDLQTLIYQCDVPRRVSRDRKVAHGGVYVSANANAR